MATVKSTFGTYADKLQVMIDAAADLFEPAFFKKYFDWAVPTDSLTYVTALGTSRVEAAASIVDRDSKSPLRARPDLAKLSGEVPKIAHKFSWSEKQVRDYMTLQRLPISEATKKAKLMDLLFNDVRKAGNGLNKRVDFMVMEGLSTGSVTVTTTNNPDGVVVPTAIDLLMPTANKVNAAVNWNTPSTATPITDIQNIMNSAAAGGYQFGTILMTRSMFFTMTKTEEVQKSLGGYFRAGGSNPKMVGTIGQVNEFLQANQLPIIDILPNDGKIGIEKDGVITQVAAWSPNNVTFVPAGKIGEIHNAIPVEKMTPINEVTYADFEGGAGLISKWGENEPFTEYTKGEMNAFPGFEMINGVFILSTSLSF